MARTGVDIVTTIDDDTAPGAADVVKSVENMGAQAQATAKKAFSFKGLGKAIGDNVADEFGRMFSRKIEDVLTDAFDKGIRAATASIAKGGSAAEIGVAIGDAVTENLKRLPVAGAIGDLLARTWGAAFGSGFATFEDKQAELEIERRDTIRRAEAAEQIKQRDAKRAEDAAKKAADDAEKLQAEQERADAKRLKEQEEIAEKERRKQEDVEEYLRDAEEESEEAQREWREDQFEKEQKGREDAAKKQVQDAEKIARSAGKMAAAVLDRFGTGKAAEYAMEQQRLAAQELHALTRIGDQLTALAAGVVELVVA